MGYVALENDNDQHVTLAWWPGHDEIVDIEWMESMIEMVDPLLPLILKAKRGALFGEGENIPVMLLQDNERLWMLYGVFLHWNMSEYNLAPHVTNFDPEQQDYEFDKIVVHQ